MIWIKNWLKAKPKDGVRLAWPQVKRMSSLSVEYPDFYEGSLYKTNTRKPKGKQGKLYEVPYWDRGFGKPKFQFRKFGERKNTAFKDGYAFGKALEKKGFVRLGQGAYSSVYGKPGNPKVIKVTSSPDNWIDYVQWAGKMGYAGKFAPAVYSYKQIKGSKRNFSVAVMERMDKVFRDIDDGHDYRMLSGLMHFVYKGNIKARIMLDTVAPGMSQFVGDLYKEFGEDRFDFHDGNFMIRTDGTFAVTDPVAGKSKLSVTRLRVGDFSPTLVHLWKYIESSNRHRGEWSQTHKDLAYCL